VFDGSLACLERACLNRVFVKLLIGSDPFVEAKRHWLPVTGMALGRPR